MKEIKLRVRAISDILTRYELDEPVTMKDGDALTIDTIRETATLARNEKVFRRAKKGKVKNVIG